METAILSKTIRAYLVIGLTSYVLIFLYWLNSVNYYNILNTATLLSYAYLLWIPVDKDEDYFSNRRLWLIVFVYSLVFVSLYLLLSYYYCGNTYLFSTNDALIYERLSHRMKDMGFVEALAYISSLANFDDWGASMSMAFILKIVPSKLFLNFCYILMNSVSSLLMFDVGKMIGMSKKYAFIATLSYSIASYSMFMMGTFLKEETMMLLIILSIWCLYRYYESTKIVYLLSGGLSSFLIIFFRVPIALFVWISYAVLLLLGRASHLQKGLYALLGIFVSVMVVGLWQYSTRRYANGGDLSSVAIYTSTSLFQKMVGFASVLIGPFPTLFHISGNELIYRPLTGAGELFKFVLFLPFWKGLAYCLKARISTVYPLYAFTISNMLGLLVVLRIDFRFAMVCMPMFLLAAFWYMDQYDSGADESVRNTPYYYWTNIELKISLCIVFLVTLAWNLLVRDQKDVMFMEHFQLQWPEL